MSTILELKAALQDRAIALRGKYPNVVHARVAINDDLFLVYENQQRSLLFFGSRAIPCMSLTAAVGMANINEVLATLLLLGETIQKKQKAIDAKRTQDDIDRQQFIDRLVEALK